MTFPVLPPEHFTFVTEGAPKTRFETVIVNVFAVPVHVTPLFVYDGITVMVAVMGALVVFIAVKDAILPVPLAARPIDGVLFVQL